MSPSLAALCTLQAWEQHAEIPGGLAFERLLRRIVLDHSPASLARVDTFLDALHTARKPRREAFLAERGNRNLLDLLAFYVGDVLGRALRCTPEWLEQPPADGAAPEAGAQGFEHSLLCNFPGAEAPPGPCALLVPICARVFGGSRQPGVAASAGAFIPAPLGGRPTPLPPAPGFAYPLDLQEALARCSAAERSRLALGPSPGAAAEHYFAAAPEVLRRGRVAWGAVVQADETLARPQAEGGGWCDVVVDPQGRAPAAALDEVAQVLSALQERPVAEPALPEFSQWLGGGRPGAAGLDVPAAISPYPLQVAEAWFVHAHLPGGVLAHRSLPVVISEAHPGRVLLLPAPLWPPVLLQAWGS